MLFDWSLIIAFEPKNIFALYESQRMLVGLCSQCFDQVAFWLCKASDYTFEPHVCASVRGLFEPLASHDKQPLTMSAASPTKSPAKSPAVSETPTLTTENLSAASASTDAAGEKKGDGTEGKKEGEESQADLASPGVCVYICHIAFKMQLS